MECCSDNLQNSRHLSLNDQEREPNVGSVVSKILRMLQKTGLVFPMDILLKNIANSVDEILDCDLPQTLELLYSGVKKDHITEIISI